MAVRNAFYAQSGGVTAVINASACGLLQTARQHRAKIGKVYAGRNGITPAKTALAGPENDRAREALSHYNGAVQQLKSGNWAGFGAELDALRPLLEELSQHSTGR